MAFQPKRLRTFALCAGLLLAGLGAAPSLAENGTDQAQGSAAGSQAPYQPIEQPNVEDRGVFVTQIGDTNRAEVRQQSNRSHARVIQKGAENGVDLVQGASGTHYASVAQDGETNTLDAAQDGSGQTVLLLAQQGGGNSAIIRQTDTGEASSAASVWQDGQGNSLLLVQNGSDNQARLTQEGNNNLMTATQTDNGNRLEWTQTGTGLSDLQINQLGGASVQITQSNTSSAQFSPSSASSGG